MSINKANQEQIRTREEYKQGKAAEQERKKNEEKRAKDDKGRIKEAEKKVKATEKTNSIANESARKVFKEEQKTVEDAPVKYKRVRIRLIPIWIRLLLIVVLILVSTSLGAVVGYGILGNGKAADTFKESTWTHVLKLVDIGK